MRLKLWPILAILIMVGCDTSRIFEENLDFENRIWLSEDIKTFDFEISDVQRKYNILFNVRNTLNYPHYNIYVSFELTDSLDNILFKDLINYELFDPKTGAPLGQSGLGDIYDHQFPVLTDFEFGMSGKMQLKLQQFMRYDSLPEIVSTGIRVEYLDEFEGY